MTTSSASCARSMTCSNRGTSVSPGLAPEHVAAKPFGQAAALDEPVLAEVVLDHDLLRRFVGARLEPSHPLEVQVLRDPATDLAARRIAAKRVHPERQDLLGLMLDLCR